ncbi:aminopeptidase [Catenisphaera adipataccumulans]|uniref:Aminopeptidase n=1 Tax=Catenisphaera adipataccumulans TaxID=700500 RepID=A0A7W8FUN6_9FIRM|nr:aminopeptidase [Catenisphaera adipataccumulans]MBB5182303.1 aminopeptidase [Catenisphaera adipataccumulans]
MFQKYADLLIKNGLNVKKGQLVIISAPVETADFVRLLVKTAYQNGAGRVIVRYRDEQVDHLNYLHGDLTVMAHESLFYNETSEQGACYLTLVGDDPALMKDVDASIIAARQKTFRQATKPYRRRLDTMHNQWCIAAAAVPAWAKAVFPNSSQPTEDLWNAIFQVSRVTEDWQDRRRQFEQRVKALNRLNIESLHYQNAAGTDLIVKLPEDYLFAGGGSTLTDGTYYFPNIPTEEVFAAPHKDGIDGVLVSTRPLVHNGATIDDFRFTFKNGRVVDYDAKVGKEVLTSILDTDEGARSIGEIALVPYDSPISEMNTIFYETLIDENASCHFALGQSYGECLKNGLTMSEDELKAHGLNQSLVHVDFMVGSADLRIEAKTRDGKKVPIFVNGTFDSYITAFDE